MKYYEIKVKASETNPEAYTAYIKTPDLTSNSIGKIRKKTYKKDLIAILKKPEDYMDIENIHEISEKTFLEATNPTETENKEKIIDGPCFLSEYVFMPNKFQLHYFRKDGVHECLHNVTVELQRNLTKITDDAGRNILTKTKDIYIQTC